MTENNATKKIELELPKEIYDFFVKHAKYEKKTLSDSLKPLLTLEFRGRTSPDMMTEISWANEWFDLFYKLSFVVGLIHEGLQISEFIKEKFNISMENAFGIVICGIQDYAEEIVAPAVADLNKKDKTDSQTRRKIKEEF